MSKTKVFLISLLQPLLAAIGSLVGILLTFILSWNRYEPLFDIYSILEPFIMGFAGGYISFYVIYKYIVKSNEHFVALIAVPLITAIVSMVAPFLYEGSIYWEFYASTITSIASYIYFIKQAE